MWNGVSESVRRLARAFALLSTIATGAVAEDAAAPAAPVTAAPAPAAPVSAPPTIAPPVASPAAPTAAAPTAAAPADTGSIAPQAVQPVASTCQTDFQRLTNRRMAGIQKLNALGKAGKGKMDPIAACPSAKSLVGVEGEMLGYMLKNKEWCAIPDQVIDQFRAAHGKTQNFASQACSVAAKVKKMQAMQKAQAAQQAANGGMMAPPKLPSGPL